LKSCEHPWPRYGRGRRRELEEADQRHDGGDAPRFAAEGEEADPRACLRA
jgi:hypothetical protein